MQILVNNEPRETQVRTLADLLRELGLDAAVVATAVNGSFVPAGQTADGRAAGGRPG